MGVGLSEASERSSWAEIVEADERGKAMASDRMEIDSPLSIATPEDKREKDHKATELDEVPMRDAARAPRRLNFDHGFMRFIVRNQESRKTYEEQQVLQREGRYQEAKVEQEKADADAEQNSDTASPVKKEEVSRPAVRRRAGFAPYMPPHMRSNKVPT